MCTRKAPKTTLLSIAANKPIGPAPKITTTATIAKAADAVSFIAIAIRADFLNPDCLSELATWSICQTSCGYENGLYFEDTMAGAVGSCISNTLYYFFEPVVLRLIIHQNFHLISYNDFRMFCNFAANSWNVSAPVAVASITPPIILGSYQPLSQLP